MVEENKYFRESLDSPYVSITYYLLVSVEENYTYVQMIAQNIVRTCGGVKHFQELLALLMSDHHDHQVLT